jgi:lysophospholipase L1-like esterase
MIKSTCWKELQLFSLLAVLVCGLVGGCAGKGRDYVALGDSTPDGHGVSESYVDYYADFVREDLGVEVKVHNFAQSGQSTSSLLSRLRTSEELRQAIGDAELITLWTGWNDLRDPLAQFEADTCGGEDNLDCIRDGVAGLNANLDAILDEIVSLTGSRDVLILVADVGIPFVKRWTYHGWFETLQRPCYEVWREHLIEAAEERSMVVVQTYHALNGPEGNQPFPGDMLLIDGQHFSEEGHRLVARLHRDVGYGAGQE